MDQKQLTNHENFYEGVKRTREILKDPANLQCTCPNTYCEWYGKCKECVAQHRYSGNHVPVCLRPVLRDKIQALAAVAELSIYEEEPSTDEDWQYVNEKDKTNQN